MKATEIVQLYLTAPSTENLKLPLYSLKGFKRVELAPEESMVVKFILDSKLLATVNNSGESVILPGTYQIAIGESSPGSRSIKLGAAMAPVSEFQIKK